MSESEAINVLIASAVCNTEGIDCVNHCPLYNDEMGSRQQQTICGKAITKDKIVEAVGTLTGNIEKRSVLELLKK